MERPKSLIPNLKNSKWKQYGLIAGIAVVAYGVVYLFLASDNASTPTVATDNQKSNTQNMMVGGQQIDPKDRWIGIAGQQLAKQEDRLQKLEQGAVNQDDRQKRMEDLASRLASGSLAAGTTPSAPAVAPPATFPPGAPIATPIVPPAPPPAVSPARGALPAGAPPPYGEPRIEARPETVIGRVTVGARNSQAVAATGSPSGVAGSTVGTPVIAQASNSAPTKTKQVGTSYLPVGFVRAKILGGLDAPTNGQAQSEPLPMILEVIDYATLPNEFRANVKKCLVVAASWGDLSQERAFARTSTLNCIRHDGTPLVANVKGGIYGEDGKYGIRGRLVSKQGQILANALFAGVIGGIGQGIQFRSSTTTATPFGTAVSTANPNQGFEAGLGGGLGRALDRMANYYISLAEKIFPVIEIDAERIVDIAFTSGIELEVPLPDAEHVAMARSAPDRKEASHDD
jgi:conjugal transfer pilus assembly protein TraB